MNKSARAVSHVLNCHMGMMTMPKMTSFSIKWCSACYEVLCLPRGVSTVSWWTVQSTILSDILTMYLYSVPCILYPVVIPHAAPRITVVMYVLLSNQTTATHQLIWKLDYCYDSIVDMIMCVLLRFLSFPMSFSSSM